MNLFGPLRKGLLCAIAAALYLAGAGSARTPLAAQGPNQDEELEMGQMIFDQLKA